MISIGTTLITHIINLSIQHQLFPEKWKVAKVVPLHKKDDKTIPKNYRPVALLSVFSKILEKSIFLQTISYLEENNLLHPSHHGFRSNHNTCTALLQMYDSWIQAFEENEISAVVLVDMSTAFDVVDHPILLEKLILYGFQESAINWIKSYLSERIQHVFIEGSLSQPLDVDTGVPQGSIMGPLLYILFTNDLPELIHDDPETHPEVHQDAHVHPEVNHIQYNTHCHHCGGICCYADDSTYSKSSNDPEKLKEEIDSKYQDISNYMAKNKLILNNDKTHLLIMTSSKNHKSHDNFNISLNTGDEIIQPSEHEKLLGGFISNDLSWNEHIRGNENSMFRIITSRVNALSKISQIADFKTRKMLANGIVMSKMIYLIQLWGGCSDYLLTFLQKIQNKAARLVTKLNWFTPTHVLLTQCGWLSIRQLNIYHNMLQVYKIKTTGRPVYFHEKFTRQFGANTRLATTNGIKLDQRVKSELAKNNFTYKSVKQWNELPVKIRQSTTLTTFKKDLKVWIKENIDIN